ncbi:MAG: hypothetical protein JO004_07410 [Methylobacteriaceae bacterium]|nr:hypothetical protein [Methylobacteriaceae bacterium]
MALMFATTGHAQFMTQPQQLAGTIRVQLNFGGPVPLTPGEDQKKQIDNARVQLYENAKKECDQLTLSFDAHCRLLTLNVVVNTQLLGAVNTINATGLALYELDPEAPRRR